MNYFLIEKKESVGKLLDYFWRSITDLESLMIIDRNGNILDSKASSSFEKEFGIKWQKNIAKKISIRFPVADFHKELGSLEITVNLFKKYAIINRMINSDKILSVIIRKDPENIALLLGVISNSENWPKP